MVFYNRKGVSGKMYCSECGAKNEKDSHFCEACGAPLVVEEDNSSTKRERHPMSKRTKIIIAIVVAVVLVLGIGYKVGSDMASPKKVAKDYIEAVMEQDAHKLYQYLEIDGDKTFVSQDLFEEIMGENKSSSSAITNYKITNIEYASEKLSATVYFTYTTSDSSNEKEGTVNLIKLKNKKFLIFDNWKVSNADSSVVIVEDYVIKVNKGSSITFNGIKVENKYLDENLSTASLDAYKLPQVFASSATVKVTLANGLELEKNVTPSNYYNSSTVTLEINNLTKDAQEKVLTSSKEFLNTLYANAIARKTFADIKSEFEHGTINLNNLESEYAEFVQELEDSSNILTGIEFTTLSLYDLEVNDKGYLEVELKVNYQYTVTYQSYSDEEMTHTDSDYSYMTLVLCYDENAYHLVEVDALETYFSRY